MLYILLGSDVVKAKARAMKLAEGSELVRFGEGGELFTSVLRYRSARGLFAPKTTLLLDRPLEDADGKLLLAEHAKDLAEGDALVIIIQPEISPQVLKNLRTNAEVEEFDYKEQLIKPAPNAFALTDAFAIGDRKNSWIVYRRLIESGSAPEQIHGTLTSQARAMVLASKTKTVVGTGIHPFVYSKAKKAASRLGEAGCEEISRELVRMVHQSRMGGGNLGDLLEAFLLKK